MLKKLFLVTAMLSAAGVVLTGLSYAVPKGWDKITWKEYGILFYLPSEVETKTDTSEKYVAESDTLRFELYPWSDPELSAEQVADAAYEDLDWVKSKKTVSEEKRDLNGFEGYEILGEGTVDGEDVNWAVLGFIDPGSSVNFASYIIYWKGDRDEEENIEVERDIIESFTKVSTDEE